MLFNSFSFALFLPIVFLLYWFSTKGNLKRQNILLIIASYFFYACWDWRFLFLLIFSTLLDFYSGAKIEAAKSKQERKFWLWLSICINLGFLGVFKYYNFFADSFSEALSFIGLKANLGTLNIILPVGISFYTFHGLSYVIDIYNYRIKHEENFINYSLFVCFFPLLVAGPIERATHLLPQILKKREFNYANAVNGMQQILWGLFKKIVIADNCAAHANAIFNHSDAYSGSTLILGALFFTFQIYCDFSGYTDIALGTAKLFGIELLRNFSFPYFSRDIAEFWRRWHISLSSWFRDYLYIPLGGSKGGTLLKIRNTFIIFLVSGFWHGANWTFIIWGLLNAIYIMPSIISNTNRNHLDTVAKGKFIPSPIEFFSIAFTFMLTVFAWIFFRAENLHHAISYIYGIFFGITQKAAYIETTNYLIWNVGLTLPILITIFMLIEWLGREEAFALAKINYNTRRYVRWGIYYTIIIIIFLYSGKEQQFIYFQF